MMIAYLINMFTWKPIPGYEKSYEISNTGDVKSLSRRVRCRDVSRVTRERILKPRIDVYGYACVGLYTDDKIKWFKIHRLVMLSFIGPSDLTVNHKNMIKLDNRLDNLEYMTAIQNYHHARKIKGKWKTR